MCNVNAFSPNMSMLRMSTCLVVGNLSARQTPTDTAPPPTPPIASQAQRLRALADFRERAAPILFTTDVAQRGLDPACADLGG